MRGVYVCIELNHMLAKCRARFCVFTQTVNAIYVYVRLFICWHACMLYADSKRNICICTSIHLLACVHAFQAHIPHIHTFIHTYIHTKQVVSMGAPYAPIQPTAAENGGVAFLHTYIHIYIHTYIHTKQVVRMGAPYAPIQPTAAENGGVAFLHTYIHTCMHTKQVVSMGAPYAPIQPTAAENGGVAFLQHDVDVLYA
jgi:hypothetical protein